MPILFTPIATETARRYQAGGKDANGQRPEQALSDGDGNPCRHCLRFIPKGRGMLILSRRPFPAPLASPPESRSEPHIHIPPRVAREST